MRRNLRTLLGLGGAVAVLAAGGSAYAADGGRPLSTSLSGAEECNAAGVCGVGDPDGAGFTKLRLTPGQEQICFTLTVSNIQLPAGAAGVHIHKAPGGANGPIVVPLLPAGQPDAAMESGCVTADRTLIKEIMRDPDEYYVNVHTTQFPAGAIRGQLGD